MRDFLIKLTFLFFLFSWRISPNKKIVDKYKTGEILTEYVFRNKGDTSNYDVNGYYQNGHIKFKGKVQNGKFIGNKIYYFENGKVKEIDSLCSPCSVDKYECNMLIKRFYKTGVIKEIFSLKDEKYDGTVFLFDSSGKMRLKFETKNGKKNGIRSEYFSNGSIASKENYVNDSLENFSVYFDEKGDTTMMISNNPKENITRYFHRLNDGTILRGTIPDKKNGYSSWTWQDKNGKVIRRLKKKSFYIVTPP